MSKSKDIVERLRESDIGEDTLHYKDQREEAAQEIEELRRKLGGGCDANNGGDHTVISEGKYKFCGECGESLRGVRYCHEAKGYTLDADKAGRFSRKDAIAHSHPNGLDGPRDGITYKHESEVQSGSDCAKDLRIHDLTVERDALIAARDDLSEALNAANAKIEELQIVVNAQNKVADFMSSVFQ